MEQLKTLEPSVIKCIYILQVFERYKRDAEHPSYGDRTIGWYSTLESAVENLHANVAVFAEEDSIDVSDGWSERIPFYPYALIEKVPEGPYACGMVGDEGAVMFFKWENGDYVEMERPKELNGIIGFTMG
jgi:hypothetical protein